jgi:hypothetical protein
MMTIVSLTKKENTLRMIVDKMPGEANAAASKAQPQTIMHNPDRAIFDTSWHPSTLPEQGVTIAAIPQQHHTPTASHSRSHNITFRPKHSHCSF